MTNIELIKNNPDFQKGDVHQAILNVGYDEWRKYDDWGYVDMINWMERNFGSLFAFAILIGKYNQQVENGGHVQYYDNNYASDGKGRGSVTTDLILHNKMLNIFNACYETDPKFNQIPCVNEVKKILEKFEVRIDNEPYIDESVYDEETEEYELEEISNPDYQCIENDYELSELDTAYYEINNEFIKGLNSYFTKKVMENE